MVALGGGPVSYERGTPVLGEEVDLLDIDEGGAQAQRGALALGQHHQLGGQLHRPAEVQGFGLRVSGFGLRVLGFGLRVQG